MRREAGRPVANSFTQPCRKDTYADIILDLKKAGMPLPANDIWIAAVAVRHGATVLTYDQHFRSIARVGATILTAPNA